MSNEEKPAADQIPLPSYPLTQIYFYLTEGCNLACRHCWLAPKHHTDKTPRPVLKPETYKNILQQGKPLGLRSVKLTGGEPLLHPEIESLIDATVEMGLRITLETNGILVTPTIAQRLTDSQNPFVSVSIDGASAETHEWVRGVPGSFDAALSGIRMLVEAGIRPQMILSVMRHNRPEMEDFVRMAEALGADSVKFNLVQPIERGKQLDVNQETLTIDELISTGRWVETNLSQSAKIRVIYHHPPAFVPLSNLLKTKSRRGRCGIKNIIGVLANGSYALCGIGSVIPELIFGHADKDKLAEVWNTHPIINEIREGLPQNLTGICGDCLMKETCLGSCLAFNYYSAKDLWAPFWFCDRAEAAGLFPISRKRPAASKPATASPSSETTNATVHYG